MWAFRRIVLFTLLADCGVNYKVTGRRVSSGVLSSGCKSKQILDEPSSPRVPRAVFVFVRTAWFKEV